MALRVSAVYRGEEVTQAVLVPERPPRPGKRYVLSFAPPADGMSRTLPTTRWVDGEYVPWAWTVTQADVTPPRWHEVPRTVGGRGGHDGE